MFTFTFLNMFIPFLASVRAISWGVEITTDPESFELWAKVSWASPVPGGRSIIISTPQDVALTDARKGINMFKKVKVDILGIVENMSYFICDNCNQKHYIFSKDGVKKEAEEFKIPFLGQIPIDTNLRVQSDNGIPALIDNPDGEISKNFISIAKKLKRSLN